MTAVDIPGRNASGVIPAFADQPAIAASPARFRGECVALVTFETGIDPKLSNFPITWQVLPAHPTPATAECENAALIYPNRPQNRLVDGCVHKGDATSVLTTSSKAKSSPVSLNTPTLNLRRAALRWTVTR